MYQYLKGKWREKGRRVETETERCITEDKGGKPFAEQRMFRSAIRHESSHGLIRCCDVVCHPDPFRTEALIHPAAGKVGCDDSAKSFSGNYLLQKRAA